MISLSNIELETESRLTDFFREQGDENVGGSNAGKKQDADDDAELKPERLLGPEEGQQGSHLLPEVSPGRALAGRTPATSFAAQQRLERCKVGI